MQVNFQLTVKKAKDNFFNPGPVMKAVDKATFRNLSRFGAYVRTRSRTSIKYRKQSSVSGMPPSAHRTMAMKKTNKKTGTVKIQASSPLRDFIFFSYDSSRKTVVIGPTKLNKRGSTPEVLEYGGPSRKLTWRSGKRVWVAINVAARPYMHPAFEEELKRMHSYWKDSIKGK